MTIDLPNRADPPRYLLPAPPACAWCGAPATASIACPFETSTAAPMFPIIVTHRPPAREACGKAYAACADHRTIVEGMIAKHVAAEHAERR